ncbi:MAG: NAD-dependent epimerase/dehydratase family protein [Gemmatimonadaceae bacterium]
MRTSLFITGAGGLVGSALLRLLQPDRYVRIVCLSRRRLELPPSLAAGGVVTVVAGDVRTVAAQHELLRGIDVVVHLAGTTGRAHAVEYQRTNVDGTAALLRASERAGAGAFLHMSSIAARFDGVPHYHYGRSKRESEAVVRGGTLPYTIVRPTIVASSTATAWRRLASLGSRAFPVVVGSGATYVQPIHVDDLADAIRVIVEERRFTGETLELGGPEALTIETLVRRACRLRYARERRGVRLPIAPVVRALAVFARTTGILPPVTAGQLSTFMCDGVAEPNTLHTRLRSAMRTVDDMLRETQAAVRAPDPAGAVALAGVSPRLAHECAVFTRYLTRGGPASSPELSAYLARHYANAHRLHPAGLLQSHGADALLLRLATWHPLATRIVDAYARIARPRSIVRSKLVLALALLESVSPSARLVECSTASPMGVAVARLAWAGGSAVVFAVLGLLIVGPIDAIARAALGRSDPAGAAVASPAAERT